MPFKRVGPSAEPTPNIPTDRLRPDDIAEPTQVVIVKAELAVSGAWHDQEAGRHYVLYPEGLKPVLTSQAQTRVLQQAFGRDPAGWMGRKVLVEADQTTEGRRFVNVGPVADAVNPEPRPRSVFLQASDLAGPTRATIAHTVVHGVWSGGQEVPHLAVMLDEFTRTVLLNPLLVQHLTARLHCKPAQWIGKRVILRPGVVGNEQSIMVDSAPDELAKGESDDT